MPIERHGRPRPCEGRRKSPLNSLEYFTIIRKLSIDSFGGLWIISYLYCIEIQTIMLPIQGAIHFSDYSSLYDIVVPKNNKLRLINELVDFSFIYEELNSKYCQDNGRMAEDPVRMFK